MNGDNMKRIVLALIVLLAMMSLWMSRYQYMPLGTGPNMLRVNRFTGETCSFGLLPNPKYHRSDNPLDQLGVPPAHSPNPFEQMGVAPAPEPEKILGWDCK